MDIFSSNNIKPDKMGNRIIGIINNPNEPFFTATQNPKIKMNDGNIKLLYKPFKQNPINEMTKKLSCLDIFNSASE